MTLLRDILQFASHLVAPIVLAMFSMASAYVLRFRVAKGGLGFDYAIFSIVIIVALKLGGFI